MRSRQHYRLGRPIAARLSYRMRLEGAVTQPCKLRVKPIVYMVLTTFLPLCFLKCALIEKPEYRALWENR
jgi:hypothetical protein